MSKTYEMLWDCQFCGTSKNLGLSHRFCPSCGSPQNPDSRYYPSEEDMVEVKDHQFVGVDVTCPACNQLNSAAAEFCGQCGSPLTEGAKASSLEQQSVMAGQLFGSSGSRDVVKEKHESEMRRIGVLPDEKAKNKSGGWGIWAIVAVIALAIVGAIVAFTWKTNTTLVVTDHQWERVISIEEYSRFTERSWRDTRPAGDDVTMGTCRSEQRSTRRVADGETCRNVRRDQGDGTFRQEQECTTNYREEPVYDDMCTWTGYRWESSSPVRAEGGLDDRPQWPDTDLNCEGQSRVGCERESGREEHYWLFFEGIEDNTEYQCDMTQDVWEDAGIESLWTGQVGVLIRSTIDCATLQPQ